MASATKMKRNILVSLSLLAIVFSSEVVDEVRTSLEADSAFWFGWVKYSGYAVAVGCAMEAPETFILIKRWWLLRFRDIEREETKEDKRSWIVPLAALGLLIIVVGIVAETYCEGKVSDVDALIRAHESDKITAAENEAASATRHAGDAAANAKKAEDSADAANAANRDIQRKTETLAKEARDLTVRLAAASSKLGDLEHKIHIQGPRGTLLETGKAKFIETLKPFAGQRFILLECRYEKRTPESLKLEQDLLTFLGPKGAGWVELAYAPWSECSDMLSLLGGNLVFSNPFGQKTAGTSAEALAAILHELEINTSAIETYSDQFDASNLFFQGADSPGAFLAKDPNIVVILVAPTTMSDEADWNKRDK